MHIFHSKPYLHFAIDVWEISPAAPYWGQRRKQQQGRLRNVSKYLLYYFSIYANVARQLV